jgi:DtxR family Mn-dependent transcriptional regulator
MENILSLTEENYLKIIYKIENESQAEVSTNSIAEKTSTKAASVSDMLKKLSQKDLIHYVKYQGVTLTDKGKKEALMIIRKHRLWEVFLVSKLQFPWDEVHEIAEQLEHIQSRNLIDRLDKFLGFPKFDPHGDPIPDVHGVISQKKQAYISEMEIGRKSKVLGVKDTSPLFLRYLDKIGIGIGSEFEVTDKVEYDQSVEIKINDKIRIISKEVAQNIYTIE